MVAAALIMLVKLQRVDAADRADHHRPRNRHLRAARMDGQDRQGKSVAVSFIGKLKTTAQMVAILLLLYHDPILQLYRHPCLAEPG